MLFILVLLVIVILVCTPSITNFDIFRLGYIFTYDPFLANATILYSLKTPGNQKPSGVFRGYKMETVARNGLIKFVISR